MRGISEDAVRTATHDHSNREQSASGTMQRPSSEKLDGNGRAGGRGAPGGRRKIPTDNS